MKIKNNLIKLLILNYVCFSSSFLAVEEVRAVQIEEVEEVVQAAEHNFPIAGQLSTSSIGSKRDQYLNDRGWSLGYNQKSSGSLFYIGWGEASIKESPGSIAYIDSRVLAFESSLLTAKGGFARLSSSRIATETVQEFFKDELSQPADLKPNSTLKQVGQKIVALGNASLDKLLVKLDVDPEEFTLKQKQTLARDSLQKISTIKAVAKVSGIRPLVTFEDGGSMGVLIVYSEKLRQQASAIAQGKLLHQPDVISGRPTIKEQLANTLPNENDYIFQHGLRILKDERGNPVLVSFAQSGVKVTKSSGKFETNMALKAARSAAKSLSSSHIAEFINATINLQDKTTLAESATIERVTEGDMSSIEESLNTGKIINNFVKQGAKARLTGVTTLKTWLQNHPDTGHLIAGEVKVWSPYLSHLTQTQITPTSKTKKITTAPKTKIEPKNHSRSSANFNDEASF